MKAVWIELKNETVYHPLLGRSIMLTSGGEVNNHSKFPNQFIVCIELSVDSIEGILLSCVSEILRLNIGCRRKWNSRSQNHIAASLRILWPNVARALGGRKSKVSFAE